MAARKANTHAADAYIAAELQLLRQLDARKRAVVVFANQKPFFTAFTHSSGYALMSALKRAGVRSMYRPA